MFQEEWQSQAPKNKERFLTVWDMISTTMSNSLCNDLLGFISYRNEIMCHDFLFWVEYLLNRMEMRKKKITVFNMILQLYIC